LKDEFHVELWIKIEEADTIRARFIGVGDFIDISMPVRNIQITLDSTNEDRFQEVTFNEYTVLINWWQKF